MTLTEVVCHRLNGLIETASPHSLWEQEAAAEMKKAIHLLLAPAQQVPDPAAQFVMWAMLEGSWQGCNIDGGAAQDKAVALGLIVQTLYDPEKHGHDAHCEPGETWFVPSETLLAALGTSTFPSTEGE